MFKYKLILSSTMLKEVLPKLKRKLSSFILDESGNISKQSIIKIGSIATAGAVAGVLASGSVSASHLCAPPPPTGDGDGCCSDSTSDSCCTL